MPIDTLREISSRVRSGLRRRLRRGVLLEDKGLRDLHDNLMSIDRGFLRGQPLSSARFVVMDTETTGFKAYAGDEIVSIALIELIGLEQTGRSFTSLINPGREIPTVSTAIHGIKDEDVKGAPVLEEVLLEVGEFIGDSILVGHHINFDIRFLNKTLHRELLCHLKHPWLDTMMMYAAASGRVGRYSLDDVAKTLNIEIEGRHSAYGDALATALVFSRLAGKLVSLDDTVKKLEDEQVGLGHF